MDDLPTEIYEAMRSHHATFSSVVAARLPLCLPPHASTPDLYLFGISRFAEVFYAFESAWICQLNHPPTYAHPENQNGYDIIDTFINDDTGRIRNVLSQIYIPDLLRSPKLEQDIATLRSLLGPGNPFGEVSETENAATAFANHIKEASEEKPHLIFIYAWIMYMALLNGGRRIRNRLVTAGPEFWGAKENSNDEEPDVPNGLSFWFFNDDQEIKFALRDRLLSASALLTASERADVVAEAVEIFRQFNRIVAEIDVEVARSVPICDQDSDSSSSSTIRPTSSSGLLPSFRAMFPSASSFLSQSMSQLQSSTQAGGVRPLIIGAMGLLGGVCAWLFVTHAETFQGMYESWAGRSNRSAGRYHQ